MTLVRITIKKVLSSSANRYQQFGDGTFSSEYWVQSSASFSSPQLKEVALGIAQAESYLHPACVQFKRATVKLATPGLSAQELHGQFSLHSLSRICGQLPMDEADILAFPPVVAVFRREPLLGGRHGRLFLPHVVTAAEWNRYAHDRVLPLRFQRHGQLDAPTPTSARLFGQELLEAVRAANGTYVLPPSVGEGDQRLRQIANFMFHDFQVSSSKPKKKAARNFKLPIDASSPKKSPKSKEIVAGVVYLVKSGPHFKIGKSIVFEKRLRYIKLQMPERVEEVHVIQAANPAEVESYWHRRFASLRLNGEWFRLTDAEISEFKRVEKM